MTRYVENRWYITPPIVYGKDYYYITTILLPATTEKFGSNRHRSLWGTYRAEPARLCRKMRTDEHIYIYTIVVTKIFFFSNCCVPERVIKTNIYICMCMCIGTVKLLASGKPTAVMVYTMYMTHTHIYIRFKGIRITLVNIYDVDKLLYTAIYVRQALRNVIIIILHVSNENRFVVRPIYIIYICVCLLFWSIWYYYSFKPTTSFRHNLHTFQAYVQTQWAVCVCTYYIYNVLTPDSRSDLFIVSFLLSMVVENRFVCHHIRTLTLQYNVNLTRHRQL